MCGIVGFVGARADMQEILQGMMDAIAHRGPDGQGQFIEGPAALGQRRLSIIDLEGGKQPMFNEDQNLAVIFNGEIYNFQELTAELMRAGHTFATRSDTEVLLPGFPFQPVGGHQLFDALKEGILPGGILIGKVQRQLLFVQLFLEAGVGQKAFDLAAKQQLSGIVLVIIERLDAKMVACAEQRFVLAVPDGKSEHAAQLLQHLLAPLLVPVQQNFGVGSCNQRTLADDTLRTPYCW